MNHSDIQAIVFDAYGTLFNIASIDYKLKEQFGDQATDIAKIWRQKQLQYTWLRSLMGRYSPFTEVTKDALIYACKVQQVNLNPLIQSDLINAYLELEIYGEVKEALDQLSASFQLAVLSNADDHLLQAGVKFNQIHDYFTAVLSADRIKMYKPNPKVYELTSTSFSIPKDQTLFVSTNTWDVAGAKSYGFQVAWVQRNPHAAIEELGFTPDFQAKNLLDLKAQLLKK